MSPWRAAAVLVAVLGSLSALALLGAAPALAHDQLLQSSPPDGATLHRLPSRITLLFEEPPAAGFTSMSVIGPGGAPVNSAGPQVVGSRISEPLRTNSRRGTYTINYRIMSDDGHPVSGTIRFSLGVATAATRHAASPVARASVTQPHSSSTTIEYGAGALAVVAIALAIAGRARVRS